MFFIFKTKSKREIACIVQVQLTISILPDKVIAKNNKKI